MATSDSEDFESADEDVMAGATKNQGSSTPQNVKLKPNDSGGTDTTVECVVSGEVNKLNKDKNIDKVERREKTSDEPVHITLDKLTVSEKADRGKSEKEPVLDELGSSAINEGVNKELLGRCGESKEDSKVEVEGWEDDLDELEDDTEVEMVTLKDKSLQKEEFGSALDSLTEKPQKEADAPGGGWGSWGSWGVSSLLSSATESVSTLTSHVSQGLNTVLEVGIGAPSPEELARLDHEREQALAEEPNKADAVTEPKETEEVENEKTKESGGLFGFGRVISGVTSITKLVETAGSKVVTGGLDTLETIGKKTMDILQEGDPGLKKKRALFSNKILLSQVLREAKERAEQEDRENKDKEANRKAHFETLFDDYQGLVHLEALEMLSKQCDLKLQSLLLTSTGPALVELQQALNDLKELCQLPEEDDDDGDVEQSATVQREKLASIGKGLGVPIATEKLMKTWDEAGQWIETYHASLKSPSEVVEVTCARDIHQKAMATLARLTAESVEQFHKAAELLLVLEKHSPLEEAKILLDMTSVLCSLVSTAATNFSECLTACPENSVDHDAVNSLITNIFLEAAHSSSYIQEAFQLLVPVLQVGLTMS